MTPPNQLLDLLHQLLELVRSADLGVWQAVERQSLLKTAQQETQEVLDFLEDIRLALEPELYHRLRQEAEASYRALHDSAPALDLRTHSCSLHMCHLRDSVLAAIQALESALQ